MQFLLFKDINVAFTNTATTVQQGLLNSRNRFSNYIINRVEIDFLIILIIRLLTLFLNYIFE